MGCDIELGQDYQLYSLAAADICERVCASKCRHRGEAFRGGLAGRCLKVVNSYIPRYRPQGIVELYDTYGHPLSYGSMYINAVLEQRQNIYSLDETGMSRDVYITPLGDNKFEILYVVDIAGSWTLSVILSTGKHIAGSPFNIEIEPAEPSPYTTTLEAVPQNGYESQQKELIIQVKDGFRNELKRGGTKLIVTCLGDGSVLSFQDCKNGKHRVIFDTDPNSSFSQLKVTLMGKDIVNSPFNFSSTIKKESAETHMDPFERAIDQYKRGMLKQGNIGNTYSHLRTSLIKEQRQAVKSYHSTRLQIVHTLPVKFVIDEPDDSLAEKRKELIARHDKLNKEIEELSAMVTKAEESRKKVIDDLVKRFETSSKIHKEAVSAYSIVCRDIGKKTASIGANQWMINAVRMGEAEAVKRLQESRSMDRTLSAYYSYSDKPEKTTGRLKLKSRQNVGDEIMSTMMPTKPDRPNTLAFWMLEGRFNPSNEK